MIVYDCNQTNANVRMRSMNDDITEDKLLSFGSEILRIICGTIRADHELDWRHGRATGEIR